MPPKEHGSLPPAFTPQAARISHDNVAELKEAFFVLDSSGSGTVTSAEIRSLLCSIIPNLGDDGFDRLMEGCRMEPSEPVTFAQFFVLLSTISAKSEFGVINDSDDPQTLFAAFAPFDPDDTGFVDSSAFLYLMGEKGEKLSLRELDDLRLRLERTGFVKRGRVNYKGFISNLIATTTDKKLL